MKKHPFIAAIHVGSGDVRLQIAEVIPGKSIQMLEKLRGSLVLGEDTFETGVISDAYIRRTCDLLRGFKQKLREYGIKDCRAVGTTAIREADNRDYFLNCVASATGFNIEILDHTAESTARLIAVLETLTARSLLSSGDFHVLDIGAGFVHLSYFKNMKLKYSQSLMSGALRLSVIFEKMQEHVKKPVSSLSDYIAAELEGARKHPQLATEAKTLIAIGSEMLYLKRIAMQRSGTNRDKKIFAEDFDYIVKTLKKLKADDLTLEYGVPSDFSEQLLPAALIIKNYLNVSGADTVYMPDIDLCEGLIYEEAGKRKLFPVEVTAENLVLEQSEGLIRLFEVDKKKALITEKIALPIFDVLKKKFKLSERHRLMLSLLCRLADVGGFIRHPRHGGISKVIINSLELLCLSEKEKERLGIMADFVDSEDFPKRSSMIQLPGALRREVISIVAIVRLSEALAFLAMNGAELKNMRIRDGVFLIDCKSSVPTIPGEFFLPKKSQLFEAIFGMRFRLEKI